MNFGQVVRNVSAGYVNKQLCANTFAILTQNMTCIPARTGQEAGSTTDVSAVFHRTRTCAACEYITSSQRDAYNIKEISKWSVQNTLVDPRLKWCNDFFGNDSNLPITINECLFFFFCKTTHFHRMSHNSQGWVGSHLCNLLQWFGWKPVGN